MIRILPPDKPYTTKFGDPIWGDHRFSRMLNELGGDRCDLLAEHDVFPITVTSIHPVKALRFFGIDDTWFQTATHKDPCTEQQVYSVVPIALLTKNPEQYREVIEENCHSTDISHIMDVEWHNRQGEDILDLPRIGVLLMGSGYTYGCSFRDGHSEVQFAKLKLSNGDWLYVAFWEWYNK